MNDGMDSPKAKKRRLLSGDEGTSSQGDGATAELELLKHATEKQGTPLKVPPVTAAPEEDTIGANAADDTKSHGDGKAAAEAQPDEKIDERLPFPERLMHLLQHEVEPKALWWQKDGVSFAFEPKLFTEKVLNQLFPNKIKFESFIRKLNRWGFRRVPGQGLPPNGAAYKHPLFKKDEPELMKSMKFGQKADPRRSGQLPAANPPPSHLLTNIAASHLTANRQPPENLTLAGMQGVPGQRQLALLRTLANSQQQRQLPRFDPGSHVVSQALAFGGLTAPGTSFENQLRNRLLFPGLTSVPSFQTPSAALVSQQLQVLAGNAGRRLSLSGVNDGAVTLRNASLLGSTIPGSADLQRRLSLSAGGTAQGASAATSTIDPRTSVVGANAISLSNSHRDTTLLASAANQRQLTNPTQLAAPQFADSLGFLRLQQASGGSSGDASTDLLLLIEQERQRQQNEQNNG